MHEVHQPRSTRLPPEGGTTNSQPRQPILIHLPSGQLGRAAAGRSSYLDGGIRLFGLDVRSGREICRTTISAEPVRSGDAEADAADSIGALPDVLVSDGRTIYMRHLPFDAGLALQERAERTTLCATTGLLEDTWFHRQNWVLAQPDPNRFNAISPSIASQRMSRAPAAGKLISYDGDVACTVCNPYSWLKYTPALQPPNQDGHLHQKYSRYAAGDFPIGVRISAVRNAPLPKRNPKDRRKPASPAPANEVWSVHDPFQVRAMVLAGDVLFLAGWRDAVAIHPVTGEPLAADDPDPRPALLKALAVTGGETLSEYEFESEPVFDGMAAAYGRLYVPLTGGRVVCLGAD